MKESAEVEGGITDEELWKRRKALEERDRIFAIKHRQNSSEIGVMTKFNSVKLDDGNDKTHEKRTLQVKDSKPF